MLEFTFMLFFVILPAILGMLYGLDYFAQYLGAIGDGDE